MINKIKVPLIVTLVVIVVRILLEEMGAPGAISNSQGCICFSSRCDRRWRPPHAPSGPTGPCGEGRGSRFYRETHEDRATSPGIIPS